MNKTSFRNAKKTVSSAVRLLGMLVVLLILWVSPLNPWYWETKGPFKNWMQVVDWEGDGDLDVIVSHTRWENVDVSWAGIGVWVNQGEGKFELYREPGAATWPFHGFAAAAGDVDQDGDVDSFIQDFGIHLFINEDRAQEGEIGTYVSRGGINVPAASNQEHQDMGGTITLGDLNGDGWLDGFVAGCCYGMNAKKNGYEMTPSVSWVWINDTGVKNIQMGHILPLDFLDGRPIRQVALGDLDGDSDLDVFAGVGAPTIGTVDSQNDLILLNDGTGNLTLFNQPLGDTDSTSVALGDVNGDGLLDALVGTDSGATVWINQSNKMVRSGQLFVRSGQSFEARHAVEARLVALVSATAGELLGLYLPYGSVHTTAAFLVDLDGDEDLDALLARLWGAEIWWNTGQGEFRRSDKYFAYREDTGVAVGDVDGDGDQDIFIGRNEDAYRVWLNDGKGGFRADHR